MAGKSEHYDTLGMTRSASQDDIKRAYRKLAKKYHPDRNPGNAEAERAFKAVQRAYDVLGDTEKRSQYDRFGDAGVGSVGTDQGGQRVYQWGEHSSVNVEDLQDLFSAFGGGGGGTARPSVFDDLFDGLRGRKQPRSTPQRGADEERAVSLSFEQAACGAVVTVQLTSRHNGRKETLDVKIPPGVEEGQKIRLAGRGHPGRHGGDAGDFFLVCRITPHAYFTRCGADVVIEVPVSVTEASLGAKVDVPTLDGPATVTVPAGTAGGARLRLKGRGLVKAGASQRGDQYVVVRIVPPKPLSDEQRELLVQLAAVDQSDPRSQCAWNKTSKA